MAAIKLKEGKSAAEFRAAARAATNANQARRLLALAAIRDGKTRTEAARIGWTGRRWSTGSTPTMSVASTG